ncbi:MULTISPECIES: hypothetical protein [unclassified Leptolyngbya]|uniref:hypothetical protein n=1 Tax=unclassified Leptolyngbya TaxID=2650499 RepID=UPI001684B92A|nr:MULTISPECIES: hypothetical protein [unclassified Leptolyngbya]MBD1909476.1 hypothetical protein [Leptolyngbya sp. FACHB-8]MBD2153353.1 hypothetical protein [Leptolyngbya sp. FACHB-16]
MPAAPDLAIALRSGHPQVLASSDCNISVGHQAVESNALLAVNTRNWHGSITR